MFVQGKAAKPAEAPVDKQTAVKKDKKVFLYFRLKTCMLYFFLIDGI